MLDGRHGPPDARVIRNLAVLHRHVEIYPDQHALVPNIQILHAFLIQGVLLPGAFKNERLSYGSSRCQARPERIRKQSREELPEDEDQDDTDTDTDQVPEQPPP